MKVKKLITISFLCIIAVSGFCSGKKDTDISSLGKKFDNAQANNDIALREINERLKHLEEERRNPPDLPLGELLPPEEARLVPVSQEIIERTKIEKIDLNKLDYFLSAGITLIFNITRDELKDQDGKLIERKTYVPDEIAITITEKGKMVAQGMESFDISFPEKTVTLTFEKNKERNRFDLVSVNKGEQNYKLIFEKEKPYLVIDYPYIPNEKSIPVQGITASIPDRNDTRTDVDNDYPPKNPPHQSPPVDTRYGPIKIEGKGSLSQTVMVQYIMQQKCIISQRNLEALIDTYIKEAGKEGINHDLAIAQMCRTTNFLRSKNIMQTHNYAGLAATPGWGGRFRSMEQGVIAHIQHLKGYTSNVRRSELKEPLADPRWEMLDRFRGTIHTLDDLSKKWSPYNARVYENRIKTIIDEMRHFSS
jgi:hypothetical protein